MLPKKILSNLTLDSCCYHPGEPYFHDAYKGWTCCKKKSVDFTEFLNMKGCTMAKHSNVKPPEPEKVEKKNIPDVPSLSTVDPIKPSSLKRPSFDSPLLTIVPFVSPALKQSIDNLVASSTTTTTQTTTNSKLAVK